MVPSARVTHSIGSACAATHSSHFALEGRLRGIRLILPQENVWTGRMQCLGRVVSRDPAPVIILEGAYSTRPELADLIDLSVLIAVPAAIRERRLAEREAPAFLAAWHARWDAAEAFYFTHIRPATSFDLIVDGRASDAPLPEASRTGINDPAA